MINKPKKLLAIGECMMELIADGDDRFIKSYAGDTYNALVYGKRVNPLLETSLLTAVGNDKLSQDMLLNWHDKGIETCHVVATENATIGLYTIATDSIGERSFSYWRKGSAASQIMKYKSHEEFVNSCQGVDLVFFSGISLAVLDDDDKAKLIALITALKAMGCQVAFDPNYRPKMWRDKSHAIEWLVKAYQVSTIIMPGIEEHEQLFGHKSYQDIEKYCRQFSADEIIIKSGMAGVYGFYQHTLVHYQPFVPAPKQVDSTAAGDSFAGTYLASRLADNSIEKSIKKACFVAGQVVQHKGAIIAKAVFDEQISKTLANF